MDINKILSVKNLACNLMADFGLYGWEFGYRQTKFSLGSCSQPKRRIHLSIHFADLNPINLIEDTIRHEIAHALTPWSEPHHGDAWKCMCLITGAKPEALKKGVVMPTHPEYNSASAIGKCKCKGAKHIAWNFAVVQNKICHKCSGSILWDFIKNPICPEAEPLVKNYFLI